MISVLRLSVMTYRARAAAGAGSWTRTALLSTATAVVPTRPMPAYARFAKEQYADAVKTLAEDAPKTQAFKIIGASWQAMDEKERTKYTTAYDKDFVEYKKECAKYIAAGGDPESLILRHKIKKPRRDPTKPKRVSCRKLSPPPSPEHSCYEDNDVKSPSRTGETLSTGENSPV